MHWVWFSIYCAMQALAQVFFKWGSATEGRWLLGFVLGNVFGASSIWLLLLLYRVWNANVALAVGSAGGFLCAPAALAMVFRLHVTPLQYGAALLIAGGMALFVLAAKP